MLEMTPDQMKRSVSNLMPSRIRSRDWSEDCGDRASFDKAYTRPIPTPNPIPIISIVRATINPQRYSDSREAYSTDQSGFPRRSTRNGGRRHFGLLRPQQRFRALLQKSF